MSLPLSIGLAYNHQSRQLLRTLAEESEDEDNLLLQVAHMERSIRLNRNSRQQAPRNLGYAENVVPRFNTREFQSHFRMPPETFNILEDKISPLLVRQADEGRHTMSPRKQLLAVIWLLGTPDSYRSVAEQFGICKSLLHKSFKRIIYALNTIVASVIAWPDAGIRAHVKNDFYRLAGMPHVIGAIDGCHIKIDAPKNHPAGYRTGKKEYSVQLQAVCIPDLTFTDCFAGYPGSVHDARILRNSPLMRDHEQLFQAEEYIIGDKAYYPVKVWCIPPFKNNGRLTPAQVNFNEKLAKSRQVIERSFALLKGRFRRLKHLCMLRIDLIPQTIIACCVLHNICRQADLNEDISSFMMEEELQNDNINRYMEDIIETESDNVALSKRDYLSDLLFN